MRVLSSLLGRPKTLLLASALAGALTLTGCGGSDDEAEGQAQDGGPVSVSVGVIPILDVAPIYLGIEQGFFEKQGLELKMETAQGGAAIVPGVVSGQYQFGFSNTTSLLIAASQNLPLKVVTNGVNSTGEKGKDFGGIVVPQDSPIQTAADLVGKRVAVNTLKNINTTTTNKVVRDAGGDPSQIAYTELPFPEIPAAVAGGDVDAGQVVEPFLTIAKQQGMREIASNFAQTDPNLNVGLYFTSQQYAGENAEVVQKFTSAMQESLKYANDNPEEARKVLSTYTEIEPAVQEAVTLPSWPEQIDTASVELLSQLALQDELLDAEPDLTKLLP
ncbi:sulfonate ABC transporter substrate-binding protein [Kineosporia sp. NBRC 101677]|uniref:ABC transporter substrate-binding protein n=1 Tax=Kineosporia sp. NBRC 101677 TaxID=3032197 RepID=UPI0024A02F94|nr:ABC transporter substrate-binding protein [Kineosporia sp. NBRC 101677]GLY17000.1 sulfonate ABC transporter substrate-binding protein [Kineosporia sp. NBRC 101677]